MASNESRMAQLNAGKRLESANEICILLPPNCSVLAMMLGLADDAYLDAIWIMVSPTDRTAALHR